MDVAKTADGQTVLARLNWGYHETIGCYLTLDNIALTTLRATTTTDTDDTDTHTTQPDLQPPPFTAVSIGEGHTCGIRADQTVTCWGVSDYGRTCLLSASYSLVCQGDVGDGYRPLNSPSGTFSTISTGGEQTCGIGTDRTITCWGSNPHGQTDAPTGQHTTIAAGTDHSCAIRTDRTIACWGNNPYGQTDAPDGQHTAIATNVLDTCAIKIDKSIRCWGWNTSVPEGVRWIAITPIEILSAEAEMVRLVNELRESVGQQPLSYSPAIGNVARGWSQSMRDYDEYFHNPSYSERYPWGWSAAGENIDKLGTSGPTLLEKVHRSFERLSNSPVHYANMVNPDFNVLGVGIAVDGYRFFVTQNFARY